MHGTSIATDVCGGTNLHVMQEQQLVAMQAARPDKSHNAGLTAARPSHRHHLPLCHTQNSAQGTQAPSTTRTSLDLGSGVASLAGTRADQDKPKLLREEAKRPGMNSPTRPRGGSPDKASQLGFNAPRRIATYDGTCKLPSIVTRFYFPLCPSPCDYKRERRAMVTRVRPP
jgi:hypothetical protein